MKKVSKILVITAPSGSGKSSISNEIMKRCPELAFSISATTRPPRGKEMNGKEYYFITVSEFQKLIEEDAFLEWEMVYKGKYYGTLKSEIDRIRNENKKPFLDIDVVGAAHLKAKFPNEVFVCFVKPPSIEALGDRLRKRGTDNEQMISERLAKATYELGFESKFDKVILNDDLNTAIDEFYSICKTLD